MPLDLKKLAVRPAPAVEKHDLKALAVKPAPAVEKHDLRTLVDSPFKPPKDWQRNSEPDTGKDRFAPVGMSGDLARILGLPRREPIEIRYPIVGPQSPQGEALIDMMTARWSRGPRACACAQLDAKIAAGHRECLKRLNIVQAWTLYEIGIVGGAIGMISVGSGKTIIDILAILALNRFDPKITCGLLTVPPNLVEQLHHEYLLLREHFVVPELWMHAGKTVSEKAPGMPVLHVRPYSLLSGKKHSAWVSNLNPHAVIADECDQLSIVNGAGTSRIMRHFYRNGETAFVGHSGSMTDHDINEYYHLLAMALKWQSPLPLQQAVVDEWGRFLNPSESPAPAGELRRLCLPGDDDVHEGFRRRLTDTMGVIVVAGSSVDVRLVVQKREAPPLPEAVAYELDKLRKSWTRPDGEELVDKMAVAQCALELACGMYYHWWFPRGEPKALIDEWLEARKDFNKELRQFLLDRQEHLDSPSLAEEAAMRFWGDLPKSPTKPEWEAYCWPRWNKVRKLVKPKTRVQWIDEFLAYDAAEFGHTTRGIIWYQIREFGMKIADISGLPLHDGGPTSGVRLLGGKKGGKVYRGEDGSRSIVCSIPSHYRGRDGLQRIFHNQLVTNPPSSSKRWEQLLGRAHRQGQRAEQVNTWLYAHTPELEKVLERALGRSEYVSRTTLGVPQKLVKAFVK